MIHLQQVALRRGERCVLDELNLDFRPGTITALVGRSGVGKSSLLSLLNGLLPPAQGVVWSDSLGCLTTPALWRQQQRQIATVFQAPPLIERLSALENVLLGLAEQRHPLALTPWPKSSWLKAAKALETVGLLPLAQSRVDRLSGGERQRVGLARALIREPALLLADEPLSAVDPAWVHELVGHFRQLAGQGCTLIIAMHQMETALTLADRILGLADGRVVFDGPAQTFDLQSQQRVFPPILRQVA